jgi:hypothetical protein
MNKLAMVIAASALGCIAWNVFSHERSVRPPDGVLVEDRPMQHNYVDDKPTIRHGAWKLIPRAHYDIKGRVLQHVTYTDDWWKDLAPIDVSLGWQDMSDNATLAGFAFNEHDRTLYTEEPHGPGYTDYYWMMTETSNNHLIPEDAAIEEQLRAIRVGNVVELEGELVDVIEPDGTVEHTSMVRNDDGDHACEILLVRRVKIKY